ncbi:hypothetical protein DH2020_034741 [Rehmannia glutinosa]|uniref:SWI/SNF complex subunit SWI3C-like protein n=1 Tax=Rehmannia glutinosa TaxID=99300 RepID=A0ABR0VBS6_REHGL
MPVSSADVSSRTHLPTACESVTFYILNVKGPYLRGKSKVEEAEKEHRAARTSKLKEPENDDTFEDNEDDDDLDLDPPQNHLETDDDPHNNRGYRANQMSREKESEMLVDGGLRICEFPIAIKRVVNRPHSLVFGIVEAERAARNGEIGGQGQVEVAVLENISYGQLQALSAVPRDSPALLGAPTEETESGGGSGPHVIMPPRIIAGNGVPKRLGSAGRVHVVPVHSELCVFLIIGGSSTIVHLLLRMRPIRMRHIYARTQMVNFVPSAALKSVDSLIQFDKPKCRLKAADAYPELARRREEDSDFDTTIREQLSEHQCHYCSRPIPTVCYQSQKEADVLLCLDCFHEGRFVAGHSSLDFLKVNSMKDYGDGDGDGDSWSDQETLLLLEGMQLYNENWNKIAEHVGSKSKAQCIVHFVRLPLSGAQLESIDLPSTSGSSNFWSHDNNHERLESNSNGFSVQGCDTECKFPFANSGNPVMNLVAFLASTLGPRVAAACAHASLASLSKDADGSSSQNDEEAVTLSAAKVKAAAKDGLAAAAMKAKLFADHEEREIQRLSANIINHQLKRLELKLKQFAEVETLLMRECEQMERTRQRITSERALMRSPQFVSTGVSPPMGPPGIGALNTGNSRQQVSGAQNPPSIPGYGNSQYIHPHMHQQGMYGHGPRFPLAAIQPSSSASNSNSMFGLTSNSQSSLGHSMLRPVTGAKSGLG